MHEQACSEELHKITNAEHISFTDRCNHAILASFRALKVQGYDTVLMQDQGGWITYSQYAKKLKLRIVYLDTDYGKINPHHLKDFLQNESITAAKAFTIINSLAGYAVTNDMHALYHVFHEAGIPVINDVSGSIGTRDAMMNTCDIMVGSFGPAKPINLGAGGFLAHNDSITIPVPGRKKEIPFDMLLARLEALPKRRAMFTRWHRELKHELRHHDIIHKHDHGINVIIKFTQQHERDAITSYCDVHEFEYTLCPRYIRVNCDAVSIEVKRL